MLEFAMPGVRFRFDQKAAELGGLLHWQIGGIIPARYSEVMPDGFPI
jgi:hypothetical protein